MPHRAKKQVAPAETKLRGYFSWFFPVFGLVQAPEQGMKFFDAQLNVARDASSLFCRQQ
jgi:hypothetical protein